MSYNNNNSNDNKVWETAADDLENDESASDPLEVMLPSTQEGTNIFILIRKACGETSKNRLKPVSSVLGYSSN